MKVFIIAAQTADGFIAKDANHPAFWTSKEDKKRFIEITSRAGVCVMGKTTFSTLPRPLKERLNIVYSRSETEIEGAVVTKLAPHELISELEKQGFKEVAICGGSSIYSMFMQAGVVETIYLTIEPVLFGKGINLFGEPLNSQLELISEEKTESGTIMLEYRVKNRLI